MAREREDKTFSLAIVLLIKLKYIHITASICFIRYKRFGDIDYFLYLCTRNQLKVIKI